MRRTRQVLAVMLVTTALCADRGAAALSLVTPNARTVKTQTDGARSSIAGRFFHRLSRSFGQRVAVVLPRQAARVVWVLASGPLVCDSQWPQPAHPPISPFQFRLPPPAC